MVKEKERYKGFQKVLIFYFYVRPFCFIGYYDAYVNEGDNFYLKKVILGTVLQNHTLINALQFSLCAVKLHG